MKKPFISIIITNRNAYRWLHKCLTSIKKQTYQDYEIIFVDDNSTDGSREYVKKNYKDILIYENFTNVGFAKANNQGASVARGEFLFILNADTHLEKDTLFKIFNFLKTNKNRTYLQLDIRKYDKSNIKGDPCIFNIDRFGYPIVDGGFFYADAAALVIKRDLFMKLRGFDESYFIYLEDMDLAWRARLIGETIHFLPQAYVYHYAGGTSISTQLKQGKYTTTLRRRYDAQKNNIRTLLKNYELKNILWSVPISIVLAIIEGFLYLVKGNVSGFLAMFRAIIWNGLHITDTLRERSYIQKLRIINDDEIFIIASKKISKINSFFLHGIPSMKFQ